jgi:hypothetical protein
MTSLTLTRTAADSALTRREMFARTVRSEFTKIRSVRSTSWSLALMVLASAAWCVAYCLGTVHNWPTMSAQDRAGFDPTQSSVIGVALLGQLVIVVLGALMFTSEYATGTMRTSLTVMPRRTVLYGAKLATFAAVSLAVTVVASFGMFFLGQALLGSTHGAVSLAHPGVLRSVLITALYAEVCGPGRLPARRRRRDRPLGARARRRFGGTAAAGRRRARRLGAHRVGARRFHGLPPRLLLLARGPPRGGRAHPRAAGKARPRGR